MARMKSGKQTTDAVAILHRRFVDGDAEMEAMLEEERVNADLAQKIYDLRTKAGLSQRELAERVGTSASVICRLEDADYAGHSLTMLRRIAAAVNHRVEIRLVGCRPSAKARPSRRRWAYAARAKAKR